MNEKPFIRAAFWLVAMPLLTTYLALRLLP